MVSHMKKHDDDDEPPNMFKSLRRTLREIKEEKKEIRILLQNIMIGNYQYD